MANGLEAELFRNCAFNQLSFEFRDSIAHTEAWQALCNVDSATEAMRFIHLYEDEDSETCWPRAIINMESTWRRERVGVAGVRASYGTQMIAFELEIPDSVGKQVGRQYAYFQEQVGLVIDQMERLAFTDKPAENQNWVFVDFDVALISGPFQLPGEEQWQGADVEVGPPPDRWGVEFEFTWRS